MRAKLVHYIFVTLKGMGMGASDIVPGVSGGTIAFITGIYEKLIDSIKSINVAALKELLHLRWAAFWNMINGNFLLAVFVGILISIASLSHIISHLLEVYPIFIWSFFFGLIVASAIMVTQKMKGWTVGKIIALLAGIGIAYFITEITPAQTPQAIWFVFLSGALAICAMILPGISGSFILLLLGKYQFILQAVNEFNTEILITVMAGAAIGLLTFANLLSWLLKKFHDLTIALLAGFMVGSLNKIWPWKVVEQSITKSDGEVLPVIERNVTPFTYQQITGNEAFWEYAVVLMIAAMILIFIIDRLSHQNISS